MEAIPVVRVLPLQTAGEFLEVGLTRENRAAILKGPVESAGSVGTGSDAVEESGAATRFMPVHVIEIL
jgi:hypothetical protein